MKVLFVCQYNVGRSQMAKAFYNQLTNSQDAEAAGTNVKEDGQNLTQRKKQRKGKNFFVLDVMKEEGLDLSQAKRKQLTQDMLRHYDCVICMADRSITPKWLLESPNYIYWDIKDPRGQSFEVTAKARDLIKKKVKNLVKNND